MVLRADTYRFQMLPFSFVLWLQSALRWLVAEMHHFHFCFCHPFVDLLLCCLFPSGLGSSVVAGIGRHPKLQLPYTCKLRCVMQIAADAIYRLPALAPALVLLLGLAYVGILVMMMRQGEAEAC